MTICHNSLESKSELEMAWTDQCKMAFKTSCDVLLWKQEKQTKKGIMKILVRLSEESGIPQKTLYRWWNQLEKEKKEHLKSLKNETNLRDGVTTENDEEKECDDEAVVCKICKENPPREGHPNCSSCDNKKYREERINEMHRVAGAVKSIRNKIKIEGSGNPKWRGKIPKAEYEQFINTLIETVKVWEEVSE